MPKQNLKLVPSAEKGIYLNKQEKGWKQKRHLIMRKLAPLIKEIKKELKIAKLVKMDYLQVKKRNSQSSKPSMRVTLKDLQILKNKLILFVWKTMTRLPSISYLKS